MKVSVKSAFVPVIVAAVAELQTATSLNAPAAPYSAYYFPVKVLPVGGTVAPTVIQ